MIADVWEAVRGGVRDARIRLLFTKNLDLIRDAYESASVAEGLWEAG